MALELRQQLKLTQQLIMTPQLQMAIKLLQLSRMELLDTIQQELEENPALEEVQETLAGTPGEETETRDGEPDRTREVTIEEKIQSDIDWSNYLDEYNAPGRTHFESESRESPRYESFIAKKDSLEDHLLWQLLMTSPSPLEEQVGSLIIGNLNRDGYLDATMEDIALAAGTDLETAENILKILQTFDPVGICARDLRESLLIQTTHFGYQNTIVEKMIRDHLTHLENKNYKAICRALKAGMDEVVAAVNIIRSFEPRPGRQFGNEEPRYITPDIYVHKMEDEFVISLNDDGMPRLRVNSFYRNSLAKGQAISGEAENYIHEKLRSAAWLIKSIHQRQKTIYRVMDSILKFQYDFFENGIAHLRPMVLRDIALDINMHESTISRVTTNKYAHTPQGIFELKYFFNSSIQRDHGEAIASASVQEKIRQIIAGEDSRKPLSDERITRMLKAMDINIARRTVAKYREMLGVLPSNKRKQP